MTAFDVAALRREFPALSLEQDGRALAFFDGPGGTQVPQRVIDAVVDYYRTSNANDGGRVPHQPTQRGGRRRRALGAGRPGQRA